jgi:alpha-beta hydrolase superfamily lysophospholipase
MVSIFDDPEFNRRLFVPPLPDTPPHRPGVRDGHVPVAGGVRVHGRLHGHDAPVARLLLFHGNGEDVTDYDRIASRFLAMAVTLAVFGYRGYAESDGVPTLRALMEDARPVLAYLLSHAWAGQSAPVIVMGRSLGSGPAIELAAHDPAVDALVLESGYSDPVGMIKRRGLSPPNLTEEELAVFSNQYKMQRVTVPLLVLHGRDDTLILPDEAVMNHHAARSRQRELVVLDGVGHNDISLHPRYYSTIESFVRGVVNREADTGDSAG